ncbi:hypothetical protein VAR608DRAFT_6106 [Variovorax sp. HW608]|uniref:hypothetical protein n=1 Tax=Variovorax sp. HW608 TaxID=1034889 RepID=UPI00081FEB08|nr:hypothetical protein [Variovorax sp. HW608]SCK57685.1 hypothetical protein VAR608DRAFT_6106 [Variovorax sp. HW608]
MNASLAALLVRLGVRLLLGVAALGSLAAEAKLEAGSAQAMRELHRQYADPLAHSPLKRAVVIDSAETDGGLQGDIYAIVDHPIDEVRRALERSSQWCDMLVLHINNRRCRAMRSPDGEKLTLSVVPRYDKPIEQAFELGFVHRIVHATRDYLQVELYAEEGPMGTSQYRVMLEAIPLGERQTFLHFAYAYDHNMVARLATMAYLATFGSSKVGFTVVGKTSDGQPDYIRGLRGLMERNAMRYFLSLDAYLDGFAVPPPERADKRLHIWFQSVEQYPTQLHEVDLATYLAVKREDRQRDAVSR